MSTSAEALAALLDALEAEDKVLRARATTFALVSAYDGEIADAEIGLFVESVCADPEGPSPTHIEQTFTALASAMRSDLEAAGALLTRVCAEIRDDPKAVSAVISSARKAAVADADLANRESVALQVVGEALGVDPDAL